MQPFRIIVYRQSPPPLEEASIRSHGVQLRTLAIDRTAAPLPMEVSFDTLCQRLSRWPGMFVEPDGSFVWRGDAAARRWQLDGQLTDDGTHMLHVELSGQCPESQFDNLLSCLDWPSLQLMFLLVKQGVYVAEVQFRQLVFDR